MERAARALRLALRLPGRRHRAARARALPLRARPAATQGLPPVLPPVLVREEAMYGTGFFPTETLEHLRARERRALPDRDLRGRARRPAHGRDPRASCRCATPASRRTSAARRAPPGKDTRGMFRVHQFNKVEMFVVLPPGGVAGRARAAARDRGGDRRRSSGCPTASSTSPPATSAPRRRRSTTSRRGSRPRSATARSRRRRTRPTSRRGACGSATGRGRRHRVLHTLNGTAVTDRVVLAVLENFQGDVPDVLRAFGAPARVER